MKNKPNKGRGKSGVSHPRQQTADMGDDRGQSFANIDDSSDLNRGASFANIDDAKSN